MTALRRHNLTDKVDHVVTCRPDRQASRPGVARRIKVAELWRQVSRCVIADLVTIAATVGFHKVDPLLLGFKIFRNAVALVAGAGEAALVGNFDHRGPVHGGIVLRRRGQARCDNRGQVQELARVAGDLVGIHKAVAADPDAVVGIWQVGDDVSAALVGDNHLGEAGAEVPRLGDDPDAGLGSETAGYDPADRFVVDRDRRSASSRRRRGRLAARYTGRQKASDNRKRRKRRRRDPGKHVFPPSLSCCLNPRSIVRETASRECDFCSL